MRARERKVISSKKFEKTSSRTSRGGAMMGDGAGGAQKRDGHHGASSASPTATPYCKPVMSN